MVCVVSLLCRNVLPLGGASERSNVGPLTHNVIMGGTISGNLYILVIAPIKNLDSLSLNSAVMREFFSMTC